MARANGGCVHGACVLPLPGRCECECEWEGERCARRRAPRGKCDAESYGNRTCECSGQETSRIVMRALGVSHWSERCGSSMPHK